MHPHTQQTEAHTHRPTHIFSAQITDIILSYHFQPEV